MQTQQDDKNLQELWTGIVAGADLPQERISLWLQGCVPVSLDGSELVVRTPRPFVQDFITENFLSALNQSASKGGVVSGIRLESPVPEENKKEPQGRPLNAAASAAGSRRPFATFSSFSPFAQSAPAPEPINLNPNYTFDTFVTGRSNRLAHAASRAVAESPGTAYNPLFIWGGVGLGKTHLMHAICHYALEHSRGSRVLYLSAEKFLNEFIQAIANSRTAQFKERYRNVDILLVDDIQFLGKKDQSQEEFFHTFNTLHDGKKQVVICSDRQPSELHDIEDRLTSRFAGGLVADIQPPDLETRIAILQKKAALRNYILSDDVIHFLAQYIPSNIRELEGALNRVIAYSELSGSKVTIEKASVWLQDVLRMDMKKTITIENIKTLVAEHFNVNLDDLSSPKRTAELAQPRQLAMYLCREMTDASLQQIAHAFRKKDHTTVIHAQRKIEELVKADPEIKKIVDDLKNKL